MAEDQKDIPPIPNGGPTLSQFVSPSNIGDPGTSGAAATAAAKAKAAGKAKVLPTVTGLTKEKLDQNAVNSLADLTNMINVTRGDTPKNRKIPVYEELIKTETHNILATGALYECVLPTMYWKPESFQSIAFHAQKKETCAPDRTDVYTKIPGSGTRWVGYFQQRPGLCWMPYQPSKDKKIGRASHCNDVKQHEDEIICGGYPTPGQETQPWVITRPAKHKTDKDGTITGFEDGWWRNNLAKQSPRLGCQVYEDVVGALKIGWVNRSAGDKMCEPVRNIKEPCFPQSISPYDDPDQPFTYIDPSWWDLSADADACPFVVGAKMVDGKVKGGSPKRNHHLYKQQISSGRYVGPGLPGLTDKLGKPFEAPRSNQDKWSEDKKAEHRKLAESRRFSAAQKSRLLHLTAQINLAKTQQQNIAPAPPPQPPAHPTMPSRKRSAPTDAPTDAQTAKYYVKQPLF